MQPSTLRIRLASLAESSGNELKLRRTSELGRALMAKTSLVRCHFGFTLKPSFFRKYGGTVYTIRNFIPFHPFTVEQTNERSPTTPPSPLQRGGPSSSWWFARRRAQSPTRAWWGSVSSPFNQSVVCGCLWSCGWWLVILFYFILSDDIWSYYIFYMLYSPLMKYKIICQIWSVAPFSLPGHILLDEYHSGIRIVQWLHSLALQLLRSVVSTFISCHPFVQALAWWYLAVLRSFAKGLT